jgi:hypothetical protein
MRDEVFDMARKSHLDVYALGRDKELFVNRLEAFAKLVAVYTLSNIDPSKFMSYQEGFEAGNRLAIDGFCKQLRQLHDAYSCASDPSTIRTRGES